MVGAKSTKTEFNGTATWAGGDSFTDKLAGVTTHRRLRATYFTILSENEDLDGSILVRIVNFNRNEKRNSLQRWGTFEIKSGDVVLWRGSWRGSRRPDSSTIEEYVGHGIGDTMKSCSIRFTLTSGSIYGTILCPNK